MGLKEAFEKIDALSQDIPDKEYVLNEIKELLDDYDVALRMMVGQYCTYNIDGREILSHHFMSAGEFAFKVLGLEEGQSAENIFEGII